MCQVLYAVKNNQLSMYVQPGATVLRKFDLIFPFNYIAKVQLDL